MKGCETNYVERFHFIFMDCYCSVLVDDASSYIFSKRSWYIRGQGAVYHWGIGYWEYGKSFEVFCYTKRIDNRMCRSTRGFAALLDRSHIFTFEQREDWKIGIQEAESTIPLVSASAVDDERLSIHGGLRYGALKIRISVANSKNLE